MDDYHSIWLYIPTSVIPSDPIEGSAGEEELLNLAILSVQADDLAAEIEAKEARLAARTQRPTR